MSMDSANKYRHWKPEHDEQNIAWLHLAMADSRVNLLAGEVLDELGTVLDELAASSPQGIIILSDKPSGFIFGADIKEFLERSTATDPAILMSGLHELLKGSARGAAAGICSIGRR